MDAAAVYLKSVSKVPDTNKVVVLILVHAIEFCNSYLTLLGLAHRTTVVFEGVQKQFSHLTCTMGILYKSLLAGPKGCPTGFWRSREQCTARFAPVSSLHTDEIQNECIKSCVIYEID